jgi:putative SOS response-associated peptidase YedK
MCGRFTLTKSGEEVAEAFGLDAIPEIAPRYNIAPSQEVLAVRQLAHGETLEATLLRWGLRSQPGDKPLINARSETAATRGAFREAYARRRCLVPADGFYEWQGPKGTKRQPYHLRLREHTLFGIAGLWEPGLEGEAGTLTLLTTAPNDLVERIHDRMPLILAPADYARWLDPDTRPPDLRPLLGPYPTAFMEAFPVGFAVNNPRLDDPHCLDPPTASPAPLGVQGRLL